jgi:hypothetical protein
VADHRGGLAVLEHALYERDGGVAGSQEVTVRDSPGNHHRVELEMVGVGEGAVHRERVALVEVVEGLDLIVFRSEQIDLGAGLVQRIARAGELDFLDPLVGDEDRDSLALQLV